MKENKINILHLRDSPWVDGPGRTILETGVRIDHSKYGYCIGAFCKSREKNHPFIQTAVERHLTTYRIDESYGYDFTILPKIRHLIEKERIDILHAHEVRSDILGLIAGKLSGVAVMTTIHGWIANNPKGRLLTRVDKGALRFFDHVVVVSEKMKNQALECGVRPDRVTVLQNALVLDKYKKNAEDKSFRRDIGVDERSLLVGNIGRLSPEKAQADFIMAARLVLEQHPDARFLLVGTGSEQARLEALVERLKLKGKVLFLGYRTDMASIYNSLDIVVQSSLTEGMPNVILEALAMGVPVIATDVGGTSEAVIHEDTGTLVEPGRPDEIAKYILKYVNSRSEYKQMADRGIKLVSRKFCIDERTRKLSELYDLVYSRRNERFKP